MEKFLQIAPHSLAIVLGPAEGLAAERPRASQPAAPAQPRQLARHHIGYEIFADFKAENMQHFWNKKVTAAVAETFFLGWIDEQVLLIQGKEEHLEALREGWTRGAALGSVSVTFSELHGPRECERLAGRWSGRFQVAPRSEGAVTQKRRPAVQMLDVPFQGGDPKARERRIR
ncbi:hypothetical protein H920_12502 [Fukomys damarensis]|uniref:Storkhead-box protein 1 n=1 Tax=Fukomys damarensis TaxID=885580 RepID=A0A091DTI8_FUKDA|nr:hypothetical protein H920_12502 [Fukomys damarensis]